MLTITPERAIFIGEDAQITCAHGYLYQLQGINCPQPREIKINETKFFKSELHRPKYSYMDDKDLQDPQYPCRFTLTHHNVTAMENGTRYQCIYSFIGVPSFHSNEGILQIISKG